MDSFKDYKPVFNVNINDLITECLDNPKTINTLLNINKDQLWDGQSSTGDDLRPYYSEDPYFKTPEQAEAYKNWKKRITYNTDRYDDAPNLFINGYFYRSITINVNSENMMEFGVENSFAADIVRKYPLALGINPDNLNNYVKWNLLESLGKLLKKRFKIA